jgi:hypothetical protein
MRYLTYILYLTPGTGQNIFDCHLQLWIRGVIAGHLPGMRAASKQSTLSLTAHVNPFPGMYAASQ